MERDPSRAAGRKKKWRPRHLDDGDIAAILKPVAPSADQSIRLKLKEEINFCVDMWAQSGKITRTEKIKKAERVQEAALRFYEVLLEEMWSGDLAH
jgi:hypothetical protein